jgi:chemosensory pili system protein ChpA (sensor histidine kinase/response regulator)
MVAEAEPEAAIDTVAKTVPEIVFTPTARFEAAPVLGRTEQHAAGGVQESVRVRSDLLDELVNQAGEINIFHSRVEEQVTGFSNNLQELEQTITRLARQVRSLEGEAEAQVLAHWQRDEPIDFESTLGGLDFDPLELDRYSKIQQLSRGLSESINDLLSIQGLMGEMVRDTETLMVQQTRLSTDLQDGLMRTRMIPFATLLPRLRRVVRQVSNELDKQVEIRIVGESSEMDRKLLESMTVPLEHMLRNAVAHGIESADLRAERGKDRAGHILVQVKREGNEVVILVEDDGGGIPVDAIRDKALEKGLIQAVDELNDEEVMQLILQSGFSTADNVSQVAGRGVGMDIVNTEIKQLNGSLTISSVPGKGTRFRIVLPFTLAINRAMLITVEDEHFAIPMGSVEGVVRLTAKEAREKLADESTTIEYAGQQYPLRSLSALLLQRAPDIDLAQAQWPVLLLRAGEHRIGLLINAIEGNREVVIKSLGPLLSKLASISGATILGDGKVVLVLDVPGLLRSSAAGVIRPLKKAEAPRVRQPLIMVVDDSITIRKVTARMLERHHYQVVTAKDGIDAITRLQEVKPDLMLLDIEMPRMDGYELAGHIRNQKDIKHLPIIMITSRTGQKHKDRAMALGVNRYLGKPYQENELMENITSLLRESQEA